jgi:flagellar hook-associated protein FlgK
LPGSEKTVETLASDLGQTQAQLSATQAVVGEQRRTETELRQQATMLQASLGAATADVAGLFQKIGQCAAVVAHEGGGLP